MPLNCKEGIVTEEKYVLNHSERGTKQQSSDMQEALWHCHCLVCLVFARLHSKVWGSPGTELGAHSAPATCLIQAGLPILTAKYCP